MKSLTPEIHAQSSTSTVTFESAISMPSSTLYMQLPKPPGNQLARDASFDSDFHGITTLFAPPLEDHKVDVVAISGLGGHAFGSFKQRGRDYMWLRDALPYDLTVENTDRPMARVMIYGYESTVAQSRSIQNLEDLATSFHSSLLALANAPVIRPIILIAHSLGGLIAKQVGLVAALSLKITFGSIFEF